MASPIVFRSTDSDAPTVSGTAGDLLTLLNGLLTVRRMVTAIIGVSAVDNTTEAQSNDAGQTAFQLFQGPTLANDEAYIGMPAKFDRVTFGFGTAGVANAGITLAWEYWNGTAWTALSGLVDGTTKLTVNGKVTFTIPTDWATKAVNTVGSGTAKTCFWIRVRFTVGSWTTNPLVNYVTVTGWTKPFVDSANQGAFQQGGGNSIYLSINDGSGVTSPCNARVQGFETMSAIRTGTAGWPVSEAATMTWRKSTVADSSTRVWLVWADDRTVYFFVIDLSLASCYLVHGFGDFFSLIPSDGFRSMLLGCITDAAGAITQANSPGDTLTAVAGGTASGGHYLDRAFSGFGAATAFNVYGCVPSQALTNFSAALNTAFTFPNPADGGLIVTPLWIGEGASALLRGRLRGLFVPVHAIASFTDGDTFAGVNEYVGKTFLILKLAGQAGGAGGVLALETSDTVDAN
jgi:hypothetical protein